MLGFTLLRLVILVGAAVALYIAYRTIKKEIIKGQLEVKDIKRAINIAAQEKYKGDITAADIALEMEISFDQAEKLIDSLLKRGLATINIDKGGEEICYHIPKAEQVWRTIKNIYGKHDTQMDMADDKIQNSQEVNTFERQNRHRHKSSPN
jgi:DNA replication protein DnaD